MKFVVDASIAIKWAIDEDDRHEARALLTSGSELVAPDFVRLELGNILWKKARLGEITAEQAHAGLPGVTQAFSRLVQVQPLVPRALALAVDLNHPLYDCLYVATAEMEAAPLVSADKRLLAALKASRFAGSAMHLREAAR